MKYTKYSPEENAKLGGLWGQGHTDLGSWTLLFRQPVAALQIKLPKSGEWKWVKPQDGTLTVNACDALSFLTGGYVKSTVHRFVLIVFVQPPTILTTTPQRRCSAEGSRTRRPSWYPLFFSVRWPHERV